MASSSGTQRLDYTPVPMGRVIDLTRLHSSMVYISFGKRHSGAFNGGVHVLLWKGGIGGCFSSQLYLLQPLSVSFLSRWGALTDRCTRGC